MPSGETPILLPKPAERLRQSLANRVHHGEGSGQHHADVTSDLQCPELIVGVCDERGQRPRAEERGEDAGEVLDDGQRQACGEHDLQAASEDQEDRDGLVGQETQRERDHHHDDGERDQIEQDLREGKVEGPGAWSGGVDRLPQRYARGQQDQGDDEHGEGNGQQPGHDAQRHVLVVASVDHREADGDREDDRRTAGERRGEGHDPRAVRSGEFIGELISTHIAGDEAGGHPGV